MNEKATKILWLSRHTMTKSQKEDLIRIYGNIEIKHFDKTVANWQEVVEIGKDCDILAVVLPHTIIADLTNPLNNWKPVIIAKSKRIATGNFVTNPSNKSKEAEYLFEHEAWEQVLKIQIITKKL